MSSRRFAAISALLSCTLAAPAGAVVIDFESGFVDLQAVGAAPAGGVTTTFTCGAAGGSCFIVAYGAPTSAYAPSDLPSVGAGNPPTGNFGLTDETTGPSATLDYFMTFSGPVSDLSLDLIDYRVDGGPALGDIATLTVFSDAAFSAPITSAMFQIPLSGNPVDGNIENLAVTANGIRSAQVSFSTPDVGTGIDNVSFDVPEPGTVALLGLALVGMGVYRRAACRA